MGDVVRLVINDSPQELAIKEYQGQRVVTFRDIDELHKRPEGTARKRFHDNRQRFTNGKHYFDVVQPSEIRTLGLERPQGGVPDRMTVVTEAGYLLLVKSLTDDLAWEVQEKLIEGYFRAMGTIPPSSAHLALQMAQALVEHENRLVAVESRVKAIESRQRDAEVDLFALPAPTEAVADITPRALLNRLIRSYSVEQNLSHQALWTRLYTEFRDRYHVDLKARSTKNTSPLDVAEKLGHIQTLYNLAMRLYGDKAS